MMAAGLGDGRAVAFKIADGSDLARRLTPRPCGTWASTSTGPAPSPVTGWRCRCSETAGRSDRCTAVDVVEFLTLVRDSFTYGSSQPVVPHVRRVIADNPSKFTYHGTGTYIVGGDEHGRGDVVVIDPGPKLDSDRDVLRRRRWRARRCGRSW